MKGDASIRWLARRDRAVVAVSLLGVAGLAWAYLLLPGGRGTAMTVGKVMLPMAWTPGTFGIVAGMWIVMMIAMMLPSAAPMILLFAAMDRRRSAPASPYGATARFAFGYVLVWATFAAAATGAQWGLDRAALLSPAMATGSTALAGLLFLLAGAYQLTPLKQACLRQCRSPLDFLVRYWHGDALAIGLRHGLFCLGCCWAVMALLFVGGVMNLLWIAALALFVLAEKLAPSGRMLGRALGIGLILWGCATLASVIAKG